MLVAAIGFATVSDGLALRQMHAAVGAANHLCRDMPVLSAATLEHLAHETEHEPDRDEYKNDADQVAHGFRVVG